MRRLSREAEEHDAEEYQRSIANAGIGSGRAIELKSVRCGAGLKPATIRSIASEYAPQILVQDLRYNVHCFRPAEGEAARMPSPSPSSSKTHHNV